VWVAFNYGYPLFAIALLQRRLLKVEKWDWYVKDVIVPLSSATLTAWCCRVFAPDILGRLAELSVLIVIDLRVDRGRTGRSDGATIRSAGASWRWRAAC
jgi:hypothetical protein